MTVQKLSRQLIVVLESASKLAIDSEADAMLLLLDGSTDWGRLREIIPLEIHKVIVAADHVLDLDGASEAGLVPLVLNKEDSPLLERLQHALLEAVADEILENQCDVIAVYSGFEQHRLDSVSLIRLDERLRRLTSRDLQRLESSVPLNNLKTVIDLAIQIGREGREGKKVGTMFIVGDTRRVLQHCKDSGFDPMRGYQRKGRDLHDPRVREDIKEIAQMDGAFIVSDSGVVMASAQHVSAPPAVDISISKGLGARHWAAAEITRATAAIAVAVSSSSGAVRVFQGGKVILRIEPFRRAMKWKDFESGEA
jgi:DNA integrity scanning protein DisA with diadenylate cyclase activity